MDKPEERRDAAAIEEAIPGSTATVEELKTPEGEVEVALIEPEREAPKTPMDAGYRIGLLESRLEEIEKRQAAYAAQLQAFEEATVAAVEAEAEALEVQGEVIADVADEVLPEGHEAATEHNPDHGRHRGAWWERLMGGHHHG